MKHIHFETIDSTNDYLSNHYNELEDMTVVSTDYQTHGKGRLSRIWYGNEKSIMCSVLLKEHLNDIPINILPLLVAKSVHQVLSKYHNNIKIKWPNDLLINGLKLSGILIKSIIEGNLVIALIIGFGININQEDFNEEIKEIGTSLYLETNKSYDKEVILEDLLKQIESDLKDTKKKKQSIIDYCNKYSAIKYKEISFIHNNQKHHGIARRINEDGYLVVAVNNQDYVINNSEIILSKEI
jgi:BirA family biotin operon repressor/biotin-[acetyl-CoA-carboxylase] ligase